MHLKSIAKLQKIFDFRGIHQDEDSEVLDDMRYSHF